MQLTPASAPVPPPVSASNTSEMSHVSIFTPEIRHSPLAPGPPATVSHKRTASLPVTASGNSGVNLGSRLVNVITASSMATSATASPTLITQGINSSGSRTNYDSNTSTAPLDQDRLQDSLASASISHPRHEQSTDVKQGETTDMKDTNSEPSQQSGKVTATLIPVDESGREKTTAPSKPPQEPHSDVRPRVGRARSATGPPPLAEGTSKQSDAASGIELETMTVQSSCGYQW